MSGLFCRFEWREYQSRKESLGCVHSTLVWTQLTITSMAAIFFPSRVQIPALPWGCVILRTFSTKFLCQPNSLNIKEKSLCVHLKCIVTMPKAQLLVFIQSKMIHICKGIVNCTRQAQTHILRLLFYFIMQLLKGFLLRKAPNILKKSSQKIPTME